MMRKTLMCTAVVGALALAGGIGDSFAQHGGSGGSGSRSGGGSSGGGWSGGSHSGGNWSGGSHSGNWSGRGSGNWSGGSHNWSGDHGRSHGGYWSGGRWYGGHWYGGRWWGPSFAISVGVPFAYWGYPYFYDPFYYPVVAGPAVYADPYVYGEPAPAVYTEQSTPPRYYCPDPTGYYPDVQNCRKEWLRIVPDAPRGAPPPQPR